MKVLHLLTLFSSSMWIGALISDINAINFIEERFPKTRLSYMRDCPDACLDFPDYILAEPSMMMCYHCSGHYDERIASFSVHAGIGPIRASVGISIGVHFRSKKAHLPTSYRFPNRRRGSKTSKVSGSVFGLPPRIRHRPRIRPPRRIRHRPRIRPPPRIRHRPRLRPPPPIRHRPGISRPSHIHHRPRTSNPSVSIMSTASRRHQRPSISKLSDPSTSLNNNGNDHPKIARPSDSATAPEPQVQTKPRTSNPPIYPPVHKPPNDSDPAITVLNPSNHPKGNPVKIVYRDKLCGGDIQYNKECREECLKHKGAIDGKCVDEELIKNCKCSTGDYYFYLDDPLERF